MQMKQNLPDEYQEETFILLERFQVIKALGQLAGVQLMVHDYLEPLSSEAREAAIYFVRHVLHDNTDEDALKIVKHIVDALAPDSHLWVFDTVKPVDPRQFTADDAARDFQMMIHYGKPERTLEEWNTLFTKADLEEVARQEGHGEALLILSKKKMTFQNI